MFLRRIRVEDGDRVRCAVGHLLQGRSLVGPAATKQAYKKAVEGATLIHHHLHCVLSTDSALKQSILLSPEAAGLPDNTGHKTPARPTPRSDPDTKQAIPVEVLKNTNDTLSDTSFLPTDYDDSTHLSAEEIFAPTLNSPLVILTACESRRDGSEGDEPLGPVSSFLYAGASSVIGTFWSVPTRAGRLFSKHFYQQIQLGQPSLIDIAVAL